MWIKQLRGDCELLQLIDYLEHNTLPDDEVMAKQIVSQAQKGIMWLMVFLLWGCSSTKSTEDLYCSSCSIKETVVTW